MTWILRKEKYVEMRMFIGSLMCPDLSQKELIEKFSLEYDNKYPNGYIASTNSNDINFANMIVKMNRNSDD